MIGSRDYPHKVMETNLCILVNVQNPIDILCQRTVRKDMPPSYYKICLKVFLLPTRDSFYEYKNCNIFIYVNKYGHGGQGGYPQ